MIVLTLRSETSLFFLGWDIAGSLFARRLKKHYHNLSEEIDDLLKEE